MWKNAFCALADLPLKISYPPDFSDSRHYGLLLLVYVPPNPSLRPFKPKNIFHSLCIYTHLHAKCAGTEMIVIVMDYSDLQELEKLELNILSFRFCLLRWNVIEQDYSNSYTVIRTFSPRSYMRYCRWTKYPLDLQVKIYVCWNNKINYQYSTGTQS